MVQKTFNNIRRQIVLIAVFLALASCAYPYSNWEVYKEDDGSMDSNWGFSGSPSDVLCKTFVLDKADGAKDAMIRYEMGSDPYHYQTKTAPSKPQEGVLWNDMVIMVNDVVVAKESPMKLGTKGWHRVQFDAKLLKQGENTIKFTWAGGTKEGAGGFYMGIDTTTKKGCSSASCSGGKTFQKECLRMGMGLGGPVDPKWQGEYMVRLFVAFAEQGAETPGAGNTAVNAVHP